MDLYWRPTRCGETSSFCGGIKCFYVNLSVIWVKFFRPVCFLFSLSCFIISNGEKSSISASASVVLKTPFFSLLFYVTIVGPYFFLLKIRGPTSCSSDELSMSSTYFYFGFKIDFILLFPYFGDFILSVVDVVGFTLLSMIRYLIIFAS